MSAQKASRVDRLEKQNKAIINTLQELIHEFNHIKTMSVGTYTLVKEFKDYDEAIEKLKAKDSEESSEKPKAKKKAKPSGKASK